MVLKEKIAMHLWEREDADSWDSWEGLYPYEREAYLNAAEDILNLMLSHLGIK